MPNNLNLNMSDYQKIIFANNINENTLKYEQSDINSIKKLSEKYPFVVFFTNYVGENGETNNQTIHNIWENGFRLTRFVGVDPNANKIQVGDHTLKLYFDYDTGLLSIIDDNKLQKIELYAVKYYNRNNIEIVKDGVNLQNVLIDAIDNNFTLIFRFTLNDDSNNDVTKISKMLDILSLAGNTNFTVGSPYQYTKGVSNTSKIGYYAYDCAVKYDTEILSNSNENYKKYKITSQYDSTVSTNLNNFRLRLNPISFDIINLKNNSIVNDNSILELDANTSYNFKVNIKPNGGSENTYPVENNYRLLKLNISTDNNVTFENLLNNKTESVLSSEIDFTLKTNNPTGNSNLSNVNLILKNDDNIISNNISKSFKIRLTNGNILFYCGYINPLIRTAEFMSQTMYDISGYINSKGFLLYDWQNTPINDDSSQYFYIAFTEGYENQIVTCWDAYTLNNGNKMYIKIEDNTRFIRQTAASGTGITVYKASVQGKFYGKIQIQ